MAETHLAEIHLTLAGAATILRKTWHRRNILPENLDNRVILQGSPGTAVYPHPP
jgi:hypothetical protein